MKRGPSSLLTATKGAAAPRLVSAKKAASPSRLLSAAKRAAPAALALAAGCGILDTIGNYDHAEAAPDTACCATSDTYYSCDVVLEGPAQGYVPDLVGVCAPDLDTARGEATGIASANHPGLTPTSESCVTPGCPADGGAP